jgi:hypothetical protein
MNTQYFVASGVLLCELGPEALQELRESPECPLPLEIEAERVRLVGLYVRSEVRVQEQWAPLVRQERGEGGAGERVSRPQTASGSAQGRSCGAAHSASIEMEQPHR